MKRRTIIFREAALSDLEEIWLYTLNTWSSEQADRYHDLIIKEVAFLAKKPQAGKNMHSLRPGYFSSKVKSHFIFYKYTQTEIEIVRIIHESMDIPKHL